MPLITDGEMEDFDAVLVRAGVEVDDFNVVDLEDEPTAKEQRRSRMKPNPTRRSGGW